MLQRKSNRSFLGFTIIKLREWHIIFRKKLDIGGKYDYCLKIIFENIDVLIYILRSQEWLAAYEEAKEWQRTGGLEPATRKPVKQNKKPEKQADNPFR